MKESTQKQALIAGIQTADVQKHFGLTELYPYQRAIVDEICTACGIRTSNSDSEAPSRGLILLPTGAGKSICYMLPALVIPGYSLIIYPLNALISDQLKRFKDAGMKACSMTGGQSRKDRISAITEAAAGDVQVLLTNPESLMDYNIQKALRNSPPVHVVFDEAHTTAEWGLTFRPAYLQICRFIRELSPARISAFTATASPEMLPRMADIIFGDQGYSLYSRSPAKENIAFCAIPSICREADLVRLVRTGLETPLIIFCRRRREAEDTARLLACRFDTTDGRVRFYHAGLTRTEKREVEKWFMKGGDLILCATCAFGLGVDCPGVRSVVHLSPSPSVESYVQESGRAGRDGKACRALMLFGPEELSPGKETLSDKRYRKLVSAFLSPDRCRRQSLMSLFAPEEYHPPCGICDFCTGSVQLLPGGFLEITGLVKKYRSIIRAQEAAEILKGYHPDNIGEVSLRCRSYGSLEDWEYNWCQEAIENLVSSGVLHRSPLSRRLSIRTSRRKKHELSLHTLLW